MSTRPILVAALLLAAGAGLQTRGAAQARGGADSSAALPRVVVQTTMGDIEIEVDNVRAPISGGHFLKQVEAGLYNSGRFHRTVKMDNQPKDTVKIEVIQAGIDPARDKEITASIPLERTNMTGIRHVDGTVSTPRLKPDSARSGFFICINDQPELDFGGTRNPDGQGFGAFGRVVRGMDVVRKIQMAPNTDAQNLTPPIPIVSITRR
jgi:peptidyl-prolyl cis-trans isomerase A (cyclophilin A)